jgi:hypothetical protein
MDIFLYRLEDEFIYVIFGIETLKYSISVLVEESLIIRASVFLAVHSRTQQKS